jgi:hypothetical protein
MNIGCGRRREHPNQHCLLLWVLHNFRLRIPREPRRESSDLRSHPVAGHAQNILPVMASSGHVTLSLPVKNTPLGRILRNFILRMRRTYFRTGHVTDVTSGHVTDVTSGSTTAQHHRTAPPQILLCPYPYTTYTLLTGKVRYTLLRITIGNSLSWSQHSCGTVALMVSLFFYLLVNKKNP